MKPIHIPKKNCISKKSDILRPLILFFVYLILFLPLFVNKYFLFPLVFPRTVAFRIIIEICAFLSIIYILRHNRAEIQVTKTQLFFLIFIFAISLSAIFGINSYQSFWSTIERSEGIVTWIHFALFLFILTLMLKKDADWKKFLWIFAISAAIQVVFGISQLTGFPGVLHSGGERIGGSLGNASFLGTYLILSLGLCGYLFSETQNFRKKIFFAALMAFESLLIWKTQTRGAMLGLIAGITAFLAISFFKKGKNAEKKLAFGILAALVIGASFLYIQRNTALVRESSSLNRIFSVAKHDVTAKNRLIVWRAGISAFVRRPIFGWGWENFSGTFNLFYRPEIVRDVGSRPWYDRAHNIVIELLADAGIFGLLSYALLFLWALFLAARHTLQDSSKSLASRFLFSALVAYGFQNLFVFDTISSLILFVIILALISFHFEKKYAFRWRCNNSRPLIIALLPVLAAGIYFFNVRPMLANLFAVRAIAYEKTSVSNMLSYFKRAMSFSPSRAQELRFILVQHARDQAALRGVTLETEPLIRFAIEEMEKTIHASPYALQNYFILSELYLASEKLDQKYKNQAESLTKKAIEISPKRYQGYFILGRIRISEKKFQEGIEYFQKVIELNPQFAEGYWNLAIAQILSGEDDEAMKNLLKARDIRVNIYSSGSVKKIISAFLEAENTRGAKRFFLEARAYLDEDARKSIEAILQ